MRLEGPRATAVALAPDGKTLALGSRDGTMKFWDPATHLEQFALAANADFVTRLAFAPDGTMLATVGSDAAVRLWDARPAPVPPGWP